MGYHLIAYQGGTDVAPFTRSLGGPLVTDDKPAQDRWEQLNKCPECGKDMERDAAVGERIGLFYRCVEHGRFRYSWDNDRLERE